MYIAVDKTATYEKYQTDDGKNTVLMRSGLYMCDDGGDEDEDDMHYFRTFGNTDQIGLGTGSDLLTFWKGEEAIVFGGGADDESAVIAFDRAGSGLWKAFNKSEVYIRADSPDQAPVITICSEDVVIRLGED